MRACRFNRRALLGDTHFLSGTILCATHVCSRAISVVHTAIGAHSASVINLQGRPSAFRVRHIVVIKRVGAPRVWFLRRVVDLLSLVEGRTVRLMVFHGTVTAGVIHVGLALTWLHHGQNLGETLAVLYTYEFITSDDNYFFTYACDSFRWLTER